MCIFFHMCDVYYKKKNLSDTSQPQQDDVQWEIQLYLMGASSWYINNAAWPHIATALNKQQKHL